MDLISELKALGCNTDEGLGRFMGNAALYEKMLRKFPSACAPLPCKQQIEAGQIQEAIESTHTLKGVTGNLSLTPLYEGYTEIVNLLRQNQVQEAGKKLDELLPVQSEIIALLES